MLLIDIAKKLYNKNEIKDLVSVCNNILHEVPSKLEIQCKKGMYFLFDFCWYSIHFDIVRYEKGGWWWAVGGWGCEGLNGQNLLSMKKVGMVVRSEGGGS